MTAFDSISVWLLGLGLLVALSIILEVGYQIGKRVGQERDLSKHPVEASVTAALLGLLSFMLAFSFGAAASRYAKLRDLALEDANLAGTAYLRAQLLPTERVAHAQAQVREYLRLRHEAVKHHDDGKLALSLRRSKEIQQELWGAAMDAVGKADPPMVALFIGALNELIDHDARRYNVAFSNRLPVALWATLGLLGVMSTAMIGLTSGLHGKRSRLATTALLVAFVAVFVLIVDLDRPFRSLFRTGDPAAESALLDMGTPPPATLSSGT